MAHQRKVGKHFQKMSQAEIMKSRGVQPWTGAQKVAARKARRERRAAEDDRIKQIWANCDQVAKSEVKK